MEGGLCANSKRKTDGIVHDIVCESFFGITVGILRRVLGVKSEEGKLNFLKGLSSKGKSTRVDVFYGRGYTT